MVKDILKLGIKNLVGVPLLQVQSQLIGDPAIPVPSQNILRVGVSAQAIGLVGENIKFAKKKVKYL